jgi:hypothetical protein
VDANFIARLITPPFSVANEAFATRTTEMNKEVIQNQIDFN